MKQQPEITMKIVFAPNGGDGQEVAKNPAIERLIQALAAELRRALPVDAQGSLTVDMQVAVEQCRNRRSLPGGVTLHRHAVNLSLTDADGRLITVQTPENLLPTSRYAEVFHNEAFIAVKIADCEDRIYPAQLWRLFRKEDPTQQCSYDMVQQDDDGRLLATTIAHGVREIDTYNSDGHVDLNREQI